MTDASDEIVVQVEVEGPGRLLREAREAKKLSCQEVAAYLRLSLSIIEALERDDYSRIAGSTFARGYLRAYARHIGTPEGVVLERYERLGIPEPERPAPRPPVRKQLRSTDRRVRWITYTVAALLVVLSLLWWKDEIALRLWQPELLEHAPFPMLGSEGPGDGAAVPAFLPEQPSFMAKAPSEQTADDGAAAETPDPAAAPDMTQPAPAMASGDSPASGTSAAAASPVVAAPAALNVVPQQPASPAPAPDPAPQPLQPGQSADSPQGVLVLRFTEESWVEIKDRDGKRVLVDLVRAPQTRTVRGQPPFNLLLGNPAGVSVEFNGRPFDMTRFRNGKVARFAIGTSDHSE